MYNIGFCMCGTKWSGIPERTSYQINLQHRVDVTADFEVKFLGLYMQQVPPLLHKMYHYYCLLQIVKFMTKTTSQAISKTEVVLHSKILKQ